MAALLGPAWFERDAPTVAPDLLNKLLVATVDGVRCSARIVETEAYMPDDPASHTFRGTTQRNAAMFGPPGHLYVYLSYGIHQCANVVTGAVGSGQAVLLRAVEPVEGIATMRRRRQRPDRELANGPGKLCEALAIGAWHNGARLGAESDDASDATTARGSVAIIDDGVRPPTCPIVGPRVGITKAVDVPWRFRVPIDA